MTINIDQIESLSFGFMKAAGELKYPEELYMDLVTFVLTKYASMVWFALDKILDYEQKPEYYKIIEECKKFTNSPADKIHNKQSAKIDLDHVIKELKKMPYFEKVSYDIFSEKIKSEIDSLRIVCAVGKPSDTLGIYRASSAIPSIIINLGFIHSYKNFDKYVLSPASFTREVHSLLSTIRHELQHFIQDMIGVAFSLKGIGGMPSKNIRDFDFSESQRKETDQESEHALRDIEFYTRLSDDIEEFQEETAGWPVNLKKEFAKLWIGEPNSFKKECSKINLSEYMSYYNFADPYKTFERLKNNSPGKWKQAVKIFLTETNSIS